MAGSVRPCQLMKVHRDLIDFILAACDVLAYGQGVSVHNSPLRSTRGYGLEELSRDQDG